MKLNKSLFLILFITSVLLIGCSSSNTDIFEGSDREIEKTDSEVVAEKEKEIVEFSKVLESSDVFNKDYTLTTKGYVVYEKSDYRTDVDIKTEHDVESMLIKLTTKDDSGEYNSYIDEEINRQYNYNNESSEPTVEDLESDYSHINFTSKEIVKKLFSGENEYTNSNGDDVYTFDLTSDMVKSLDPFKTVIFDDYTVQEAKGTVAFTVKNGNIASVEMEIQEVKLNTADDVAIVKMNFLLEYNKENSLTLGE